MPHLLITLLVLLAASSSSAALVGRLPVTPGGTDYQAYFDDVLGITWLADANYAQTSGYDQDGLMTWRVAQAWVAALNSANYLGVSDWRLPAVTDTGNPYCGDVAYAGTDCGFNVDLATGELAHLFHSTLGNIAGYDSSGIPTGCEPCLVNVGPFSNVQPSQYWYGTRGPLLGPPGSNSYGGWAFSFYNGAQHSNIFGWTYAWAVRAGDIAPVPVPAALWHLSSAVSVLVLVKRRLR